MRLYIYCQLAYLMTEKNYLTIIWNYKLSTFLTAMQIYDCKVIINDPTRNLDERLHQALHCKFILIFNYFSLRWERESVCIECFLIFPRCYLNKKCIFIGESWARLQIEDFYCSFYCFQIAFYTFMNYKLIICEEGLRGYFINYARNGHFYLNF